MCFKHIDVLPEETFYHCLIELIFFLVIDPSHHRTSSPIKMTKARLNQDQ